VPSCSGRAGCDLPGSPALGSKVGFTLRGSCAEQYSNGDVWAYQFAAMLGLPSEVAGPVLGGGLGANHAFGGALTGAIEQRRFRAEPPDAEDCGPSRTGGSAPVASAM
jgi:hypothetical protein